MKTIFILSLVSAMAFGAGYEKNIMWGGKYSGLAGAAAAGVKGSDSVFYNPAGLANSSQTVDLTFNLTQSTIDIKGPIVPQANVVSPGPSIAAFTNAQKQEKANTSNKTIPGITYSMMLSDSLGLGLGYYVVGGASAEYENVDFAPRNFKAKVASDIVITEFATGLGYKVNESMRLGVSLRYTMATAAFSAMNYTQSGANVVAITNLDIKDAKSATLDSVRLGMQYDLSADTRIGVAIRTETKLSTKGKASGKTNTCAGGATCPVVADVTIAEVDADLKTVLPMAINIGVEHRLNESWNLFGEISQTNYSQVEKVELAGTITVGTTPVTLSSIDQKWKDQLAVKLAGEYAGFSWPIRFGYIHTSQVSDSKYARATFTPPTAGGTMTLGTGQTFDLGGSPLEFNLGIDQTTLKGSGDDSAQPLITPKGDFESVSMGIHTGFAYRF